MTPTEHSPDWLSEVLGPDLEDRRRLRWGFTNESWSVVAHGRRVVATRLTRRGGAAELLARGPAVARRLAAAGIATPIPDPHLSAPERGVIVSTFIDGRPAAELLDEAGGPRTVGMLLGDVWTRLASVDPSGLGLDDRWSRADALAESARSWLARSSPRLPPADRGLLAAWIEDLPSGLAGGKPAFVHGDLVPANLLVLPDGTAAVLDLEAARIGDPLLDAAWFDWIVLYHHPAAEPDAWQAFRDAAGLLALDEGQARLIAVLPAIRILEILSDPGLSESVRERWDDQLRASLRR